MSAESSDRPPRSEMMTGLFRDRESAEQAYETLRARGYIDADINVLMTDETRKGWYPKGHDDTDLGRKAGTRRWREPASEGPSAPPWVPWRR